jgi:diguanylate cyclase (GGDEF)-like protein
LQTTATRLAGAVRESDTVARFGGDEFVLLLPKAHPMYGAEIFSKRILDAVRSPMTVMDETVCVGISIGLSEYPTHGETGAQLVQQADAAMYRAKNSQSGWKMADCGSV